MQQSHGDDEPTSTVTVELVLAREEASEIVIGLVWRNQQRDMTDTKRAWLSELAINVDAIFVEAGLYPSPIAPGLLAQKRVIDIAKK